MLSEIYCVKFVSEGKTREPIKFRKGLNTILGSESGSNSIGKSTFLMIIDFIFGGMDYIEKYDDVHKNVGPHTICFTFNFDGELFYFARSTTKTRIVDICDENYEAQKSISLEEYQNFLKEKYGLRDISLSFRAIQGIFFRVYLRECCDEGHPLKSAARVSDKDGIIGLIKLFEKYAPVEALMTAKIEAEEKYKTYNNAIKFGQIASPSNKTEYINNLKEAKSLETEMNELADKSTKGLLDVDSVKAKQLAELKKKLSKLYRQRNRLTTKKSSLSEELFSALPLEKDFSLLLNYFPNANVKHFADVETFHRGVMSALKDEIKQKKEEIDTLLCILSSQITELETKILSINKVPNVSQAILDNYADLKQRHDILIEVNQHYDEKINLRQIMVDLKKQIARLISAELMEIEQKINTVMADDNKSLYDTNKSSPIISLKDESHYSFETPNDNGTGSRYKGLILFDLAMLELTSLPVIAHDSFMLKQIEDSVLEKLFELYSKTEKQIFIAIDKQGSYTERTSVILEDSVILKLSPNGNELFGRSWNIVEEGTDEN